MSKWKHALAIAILGLAAPLVSAFQACDNFGREWNIELAPCAAAGIGRCVTGVRDVDGSLGCGTFRLDGTLIGGVFSTTAFDTEDDDCASTHWTCTFQGGGAGCVGDVSNEDGPFGGFTLSRCNVPSAQAVDSADPAN